MPYYTELKDEETDSNKMNSLTESETVFNDKIQKGYDDAIQGRVKSIDQAFSDIKKRFE